MAELSRSDISGLERKIESLTKQTSDLKNDLGGITSSINSVNNQLERLANDFNEMILKQERNAEFQRAMTELVRVRQEIDTNYGNYEVVRSTMLGVLQATDSALVKKTTISRVSEELMISTPQYWLAPCLVAVSAWIGNDKNLAERAIKEAVKRDEERTALAMALICRRNNKVQTCYEWLSIYFSKQNAANFSEGTFTYIDAYVNGIFGPDEKHICDDYIAKWINEIKGRSSLFEKNQEDTWKAYCEKFHKNSSEDYPNIKDNVQEFSQIDSYLGRVNSVDDISNTFSTITNAYVDPNVLKEKIDKNLLDLVQKYDAKEIPLRREEQRLLEIKRCRGDIELADKNLASNEQKRQEQALDLVQQMSKVILTEGDVSPSEKKTAVSFLSSYIRKGFQSYIAENKTNFPESITMNVNGWSGKTTDGSNQAQLSSDYEKYMDNSCQQELSNVSMNGPKNYTIGAIACGVIGLIMLFVMMPLGVLLIGAAGFCGWKINKSKKDIETNIASINAKYANMKIEGKNKISNCVNEWNSARNTVDQFNNSPVKDIIA